MNRRLLGVLAGVCVGSISAAQNAPRLFVDDGQLRSRPFAVFVDRDITEAMKPQLRLIRSGVTGDHSGGETFPCRELVAPHQTRPVVIAGQTVTVQGTLLMADIRELKIPWRYSAMRVIPILEWTEPSPYGTGRVESAAGPEVFVGNIGGAALWTVVGIGAVVLVIFLWSHHACMALPDHGKRINAIPSLYIITAPDGYLSLWQAQLLLWTLAVGAMVFLFGLLTLQVPDIPDSLVALMGMSVATGTVSAAKASYDRSKLAPVAVTEPPKDEPWYKRLTNLVTSYNKAFGAPEVSIPKAQMVFWTVVMLILFIVKSWLEGELWNVPTEMVALTGVSQLGYLGDKFHPTVEKVSGAQANRTGGGSSDLPGGSAAAAK